MSNLALISDQKQETLSIRATARLLGISGSTMSGAFNGRINAKLSHFLGIHGFEPVNWKNTGIPIKGVHALAHYYGYEADRYNTEQAKRLWKHLNSHNTVTGFNVEITEQAIELKPEKRIQLLLADKLREEKPKLEIKTPSGNIDILTTKQIIEIKKFSGWKAAIGQVLVYAAYYPQHIKRIHLFGKTDVEMVEIIKVKHCDSLGITVTYEQTPNYQTV